MTDRPNIDDLLLLWEDSLAQGKELSPEELCGDWQDLVPEIRQRIQALKAMRWMEESSEQEAEPLAVEVPETLGRYRLDKQIGAGGFGEVWKAYDPHLARYVAIKMPRSDRAAPRDMDAFLAEARKVASLRHPGIVPVFDVGQSAGRWLIVSEFVDGTDLAQMLESRQPSPEESARLIAEVAEHLHYAHQQGFVHRDLKPSNILLDRRGTPYLTDFGIAASVRETDFTTGRPFGTLPYMTPEAVSGEHQQLDPRGDIYSLGVVFYELLTGRLPFDAGSPGELRDQIVANEPPPPKTIRQGIPDELQSICLKCLAKAPADRYLTAGDLAQSLRSWLAKRPRPLRLLLLGAIVLALALSAVVAVPVLMRHPPEASAPAPTSPADYYRLAQECERTGRTQDALAAYERFLAMNEEFVEPPLAYLQLLRSNTDAETAAKQFRATCGPSAGNVVYDLVALRLLDGDARRLALEHFKQEHPTFALAYFDLADCYSAEEMPNRSRIAEAQERACLTQALALAEHEDFGRHFIDKKRATGRLEDARRRLSVSTNLPLLANVGLVQFHPPGLIYVVDACATKILYSLDGKSWKDAEGFHVQGGAIHWATAGIADEDRQRLTEMARSSKAKLFVKYIDNRRLESEATELSPASLQFTVPSVPKIKVPKITIPDIPELPEGSRRQLRDVERRLRSLGLEEEDEEGGSR